MASGAVDENPRQDLCHPTDILVSILFLPNAARKGQGRGEGLGKIIRRITTGGVKDAINAERCKQVGGYGLMDIKASKKPSQKKKKS